MDRIAHCPGENIQDVGAHARNKGQSKAIKLLNEAFFHSNFLIFTLFNTSFIGYTDIKVYIKQIRCMQ